MKSHRNLSKKARTAVAAAAAAALVLSGCGGSSNSGGSSSAGGPDGTLTVMVQGFGTESFDPQTMSDGAVYQYVLGNLVKQENGVVKPSIASAWKLSPDGKQWTFTIRDGVTFHDGTKLTPEDVVFTLKHTFSQEAIDKALNDTVAGIAREIESVEAKGSDVIVTTKRPLPFFGYFMTEYSGQLLPQKYFEQVGAEEFNKKPIGAGIFKFVSHRPGQEYVYDRYDNYFDKAEIPKFKTIVYKMVPELATRVQALTAGQADIVSADPSVKAQIERAGNRVVFQPESFFIETMLPGCWNPQYPCSNPKVRMALDLALDKKTIMTQLYGDAWSPKGWDFVSPSSLGYSEELAPRPQNVDEAKKLLAEAGFPDGKGFPTLVINTGESPGVARLPDYAQLVAQQWEQVLGIKTQLKLGEIESLKDQRGNGELDGQVFIRDNDGRFDGGTFMLGRYGDPKNSDRLTEDPALVSAVIDAQTALSPDEQATKYKAVYLKLRDAVYTINTGSLARVWGVSKRVKDWQPFSMQERISPLNQLTLGQ